MLSMIAGAMLAVTVGFANFSSNAHADAVPAKAEIEKIKSVITAQLDAFKRDDARAAFSFATPAIQQKMGSPEFFLNLVRERYLPVYRSKNAEFQEPVELENQPGIIQPVVVIGPDDQPVLAVYTVEKQSDGAWLISGCLLYKLQPKGVST
jgi:hypothetical protein